MGQYQDDWFIALDGQATGPFSSDWIREKVLRQEITDRDVVCNVKDRIWRPIAIIKEFNGVVSQQPKFEEAVLPIPELATPQLKSFIKPPRPRPDQLRKNFYRKDQEKNNTVAFINKSEKKSKNSAKIHKENNVIKQTVVAEQITKSLLPSENKHFAQSLRTEELLGSSLNSSQQISSPVSVESPLRQVVETCAPSNTPSKQIRIERRHDFENHLSEHLHSLVEELYPAPLNFHTNSDVRARSEKKALVDRQESSDIDVILENLLPSGKKLKLYRLYLISHLIPKMVFSFLYPKENRCTAKPIQLRKKVHLSHLLGACLTSGQARGADGIANERCTKHASERGNAVGNKEVGTVETGSGYIAFHNLTKEKIKDPDHTHYVKTAIKMDTETDGAESMKTGPMQLFPLRPNLKCRERRNSNEDRLWSTDASKQVNQKLFVAQEFSEVQKQILKKQQLQTESAPEKAKSLQLQFPSFPSLRKSRLLILCVLGALLLLFAMTYKVPVKKAALAKVEAEQPMHKNKNESGELAIIGGQVIEADDSTVAPLQPTRPLRK